MSLKINAFTLPELMIVMVLTGLATAMTFAAYRYVNKYFIDFSISQKGLMERKEFAALLKMEFEKSDFAGAVDGHVQLFFDDKIVRYHFNEDFIVREQWGRMDTFNVGVKTYQFSFLDDGNNILNGINIGAIYKNQELNLWYMKQYDSYTLFQFTEEMNPWD
jgi:prepilin-type N-terminal cleavage/methylation domain-containing protein